MPDGTRPWPLLGLCIQNQFQTEFHPCNSNLVILILGYIEALKVIWDNRLSIASLSLKGS